MPLIRKPGVAAQAAVSSLMDVDRGLSSLEADERWAAARAAAGVAGTTAALKKALDFETDARVREALLTSLARIDSPESIAAILPLLRSHEAAVRAAALDSLRTLGARIADHLPALLSDKDQDVRLLSCELVRNLPGTKASQLLCDLLVCEHDVNVSGAAIEVLAEVGELSALPVLAACAARFPNSPFLTFAIQVASDQIRSNPGPHG